MLPPLCLQLADVAYITFLLMLKKSSASFKLNCFTSKNDFFYILFIILVGSIIVQFPYITL